MTTRASHYQPSPAVHLRETDHGAVLLDLQSGSYFGLDELGTKIWEALGEGSAIDDVVEEVAVSYQVSRDRVRLDAMAFVDECVRLGVLAPVTDEHRP